MLEGVLTSLLNVSEVKMGAGSSYWETILKIIIAIKLLRQSKPRLASKIFL